MLNNIMLAVFFGWIMVLTYLVYTLKSHYSRLTNRTKRRSIDEILDILVQQNDDLKKRCDHLGSDMADIRKAFSQGFHKMGIQRFDAFGKTEGEQSFVLALLNDNNDGVVLNFIYIHDGIRVYSKQVKSGKGEKHTLSDEEQKAIQKAV